MMLSAIPMSTRAINALRANGISIIAFMRLVNRRAINALRANGITSADRLRSLSVDQLKSFYWINNKILTDILAALESAGLRLAPSAA